MRFFFYGIGILYVYEECVCNAHGGWNRALELELQVIANHFVDAGNQTQVGPLDCLVISPTFLHCGEHIVEDFKH